MDVETAKRVLERRRRDEEIQRADRREDERKMLEFAKKLLRWDPRQSTPDQ